MHSQSLEAMHIIQMGRGEIAAFRSALTAPRIFEDTYQLLAKPLSPEIIQNARPQKRSMAVRNTSISETSRLIM